MCDAVTSIDLRGVEPGHLSVVVNDDPSLDEWNSIFLNKVSEYHEPDTSSLLFEGESCAHIAEIKFASPAQIRAVIAQLVWLESEMERIKARKESENGTD